MYGYNIIAPKLVLALCYPIISSSILHNKHNMGARRRRSGGGPGVGCARRPVGTYLYLHAVGDGNHVAVPSLAR
jgi:hypothetical protein